ncbi:unnamed protein product [Alternaria alternata]
MHDNVAPPTGLLELPGELRNRIYDSRKSQIKSVSYTSRVFTTSKSNKLVDSSLV